MINISKACVVGGAGFLGSHVAHTLKSCGVDVTIIDDLSIGKRKFLPEDVDLQCLDITDPGHSVEFFASKLKDMDCVFNYAAMPFIPDSIDNPIKFLSTNTLGALKILEASKIAGVKRILQVSSAEVYGNATTNMSKLTEYSPLGPPSTYASTKVAIDSICVARHREKGIPVIVLRQFNCVGERETHPYVIPEIIQQIYHSNEVYLGRNTFRDFMYAGDAAEMAISLAINGSPGEVYNMGSQAGIQIYELAHLIGSIMRPSETIEIITDHKRFRPTEVYRLCSDNSKLYDTIPLRPKTTLKEALIKTIDYFQENNFNWSW